MRLIFIAAATKIAAGLAVTPWIAGATALPGRGLPTWYYGALLLIFGVSGAALYLGGKNDLRARLLGVAFVLFGTLFTDRVVARAIPLLPEPVAGALSVIASIHLIALEPLLFWQFAWHFPRVQSALVPAWLPTLVARLALGAGYVFVLGEFVVQRIDRQGTTLGMLATWLSPNSDSGVFWQIQAILILPSLLLLVAKLRAANPFERRRLVWVIGGIVVGVLPMVIHVFLVTVVPGYAAYSIVPAHGRVLGSLLTAFSLIAPATTAYAVLVDQILDVRFIIRRAVQYALARYSVLSLMAGLAVALVFVAYRNRTQPLGEILSHSPVLAGLLVMAGALVLWRRRVLDAIDRRFFREHYDARRILVELVERSQHAHTARDIMALITSEVDRALHLERISLFVRDDDTGQLRDPEGRVRSLESEGPLGSLIAASRAPLDVDLSSDSSPLARLPELDREWLADATARLIVPLFGAEGRPLGVLTLGDKRSELPFTQEDRRLMTAVAASAALSLEQKLRSESPDPDASRSPKTHAARQCVACARVQDRQQSTCYACGGLLQDSLLPVVLAGKFEIERQVGAGGMGVVYRARDLTLNRPVAIKVLPRVLPQAVARLRREARAMAMMQHPNLAVIHSMESWRGAPVLVLEYLAGGTVADRIRYGGLAVADILALGRVVADVLHHIHRAGYLHRDIKPSNIGYTEEGTIKLLDFGLVRLVAKLSAISTATHAAAQEVVADGSAGPSSRAGGRSVRNRGASVRGDACLHVPGSSGRRSAQPERGSVGTGGHAVRGADRKKSVLGPDRRGDCQADCEYVCARSADLAVRLPCGAVSILCRGSGRRSQSAAPERG